MGFAAAAVESAEIRLLVEEGSTRLAGWVALQVGHPQEGGDEAADSPAEPGGNAGEGRPDSGGEEGGLAGQHDTGAKVLVRLGHQLDTA